MGSKKKPPSPPPRRPGRAVIRDVVFYSVPEGQILAPRGEYEIENEDGGVGLRSCVDHNRFTISYDAFIQHVNEGRISLVAANDSES